MFEKKEKKEVVKKIAKKISEEIDKKEINKIEKEIMPKVYTGPLDRHGNPKKKVHARGRYAQ